MAYYAVTDRQAENGVFPAVNGYILSLAVLNVINIKA